MGLTADLVHLSLEINVVFGRACFETHTSNVTARHNLKKCSVITLICMEKDLIEYVTNNERLKIVLKPAVWMTMNMEKGLGQTNVLIGFEHIDGGIFYFNTTPTDVKFTRM